MSDIVWENVPPFAVLTGPNGSGKSHLLQAIERGVRNLPQSISRMASVGAARLRLPVAEREARELQGRLREPRHEHEDKGDRYETEERLGRAVREVKDLKTAIGRPPEAPALQIDGVTPVLSEDLRKTAEPGLEIADVVLVNDAFQTAPGGRTQPDVYKTIQSIDAIPEGEDDEPPDTIRARIVRAAHGERGNHRQRPTEDEVTNTLLTSPGIATKVSDHIRGIEVAFLNYRTALVKHFLEYGTDREAARANLGRPPWEIVDDVLSAAGFPYEVVPVALSSLYEPYSLAFKGPNGEIKPDRLSSGERTLLGIVGALFAGKHGGRLPRLLLLDEPDAHLHPSVTGKVLETIQRVIVGELGVRVILTTHSPSTVALSPDESVFVMERGIVTKPPDRWAAVSPLTTGIVTVGPSTKHVFVEAEDDVAFYTSARDALLDRERAPFPSGRLVFYPSKGRNETGSWTQVRTLVRTWDAPFVHGLIDYDDGPNPTEPDLPRLHRLERRSIESYLLDPTVVAVVLSQFHSHVVGGFERFSRGREGLLSEASSEEVQAVADSVTSDLAVHWNSRTHPIDLEPAQVQYITGQSITLPRWLMSTPKEVLNPMFQAAFRKKFFPHHHITKMRELGMIPRDLVELLRSIAES